MTGTFSITDHQGTINHNQNQVTLSTDKDGYHQNYKREQVGKINGHPSIAGGNVNRQSHYGKNDGGSSKDEKENCYPIQQSFFWVLILRK